MNKITIFDTEYLSVEGSMRRFWSGPNDPDPTVVQIGAVKVDLDRNCAIEGTARILIQPKARNGLNCSIGDYLSELTGITDDEINRSGVSLSQALFEFDEFSEGSDLWSWGKDELILIAISCFINGIESPISARRFGNCKKLLMSAGMTEDDIANTNSGQLQKHFGLGGESQREHDALDDAISIARTLRRLMEDEKLSKNDFCV